MHRVHRVPVTVCVMPGGGQLLDGLDSVPMNVLELVSIMEPIE